MKKILIVDDSEDIVTIVKDLFIEKGFLVYCATNVQDALYLANMENPDLIISDILMPELSGYDLLDKLKDNPATRDIPVFFLTAKAEKEEINEGIKAGAVHYILKPFRARYLVELVTEYFHRKDNEENINY